MGERLPSAMLERIDVERCDKASLMNALVQCKRKCQRPPFDANDAFVVAGDRLKTKSWIGHFWGWTTGPVLVSNLMAVLAINVVHTQNRKVRLGFLFELRDRAHEGKQRVLYYDFEQTTFRWG